MANPKGQEEVAAERRLKALDLRKVGCSYRQIGTALKVSHEQARQDVMEALAALNALSLASADELRALEIERLDMAAYAIQAAVRLGDVKAINAWVRLSESRRKLLGLDAPTRIVDETGKLTDSELVQRILAKAKSGRIGGENGTGANDGTGAIGGGWSQPTGHGPGNS